MVPSIATKPNGWRNTIRNRVTPINPNGAVRNTITVREKLRSCSISNVSTTTMNSGTPAFTEFWPRAESSTVPPTSSKYPSGSSARIGSSVGMICCTSVAGCSLP
ncbi:hypothetical protein FQZ97_1149510 [compost metagenome]